MSKVINIFGSSGSGKSTCAAGLYYELSLAGKSTELATEFVKSWAYEGRQIGKFDQVYLLGQQAIRENILYNKVDYIITDSPLALCGYYEQKYSKKDTVSVSIANYLEYAEEENIIHTNFFLNCHDNYSTVGRYETEEESREDSNKIKKFLNNMGISYTEVPVFGRDRVDFILKTLL